MKQKVLFLVTIISCAVMTACANKEIETTTDVVTESAETVKLTVEENEELQTESVEPTEDTTQTAETTEFEEVIGDIDVSAEQLTMADMTEQVVGLDIPMVANEGTDKTTFENFTVIFPSPMFITEYSDNGASAKLESIDFEIQAVLTTGEPSNNIRESMGETQEYIGENYVLEKRAGRNDEYAYQMSYRIIDTTNNNKLMITLTINKEAEYQEYCNNLADEFSEAFEEAVRKNIQ
ncbi:MAG: hypothetical protein Q4D94_11450 [Bacillota bacterium]|nr:hypothetical protein [Bacillota bacterium]